MPTDKMMWLTDRSRIVQGWKCPRARYHMYHRGGRGIVSSQLQLELFIGIVIHDSLAAIATHQRDHGSVDIDLIADAAWHQIFDGLKDDSVDGGAFAIEQAHLIEAMLRGFARHTWPRLMAQYPTIIAIEQEMTYDIDDDIRFMSRPDLILADAEGNWFVIEYKSTGSKKEAWVAQWSTAIQVHSQMKAIEATTGTLPTAVIVVGLYKGYCLAPHTPILTSDLRWVPVGDLKVGDKIAGFEETAQNNRSGGKALRKWQEATVTRTGVTHLPCYKIELEDGTSFICSENHQWLTAKETQGMGSAVWKITSELQPGSSRIIKLIDRWEGTGEFSPEDAGYLAAAFDGEGCLAKAVMKDSQGLEYNSLNLSFAQNPNPMLNHMKHLMEKYGIVYSGNDRKGARKLETIQIYGKIKLLSFLGKVRPKRLLPKLNFNNLGMIKDLPRRPVKVVSKTFIGSHTVVTLETSTGTLVADGFASHNSSYGKLSTPLVYGYKQNGQPPFRPDLWAYEYTKGYWRTPAWQHPGGIKQWIADMPEDVLSNQYPMTPPLFLKEDMVARFFEQTKWREHEIMLACEMLPTMDEAGQQAILDVTFPQRWDQCRLGYGKSDEGITCEFLPVCHGSGDLGHQFQPRVAHHPEEMDQHEAIDAEPK